MEGVAHYQQEGMFKSQLVYHFKTSGVLQVTTGGIKLGERAEIAKCSRVDSCAKMEAKG